VTWSESRRITEWRHRGRCIPLRMGVVQLVGKNPDGVPACESWSAHTLNTNTLLGSKKNAPMGKPPAMFDGLPHSADRRNRCWERPLWAVHIVSYLRRLMDADLDRWDYPFEMWGNKIS
jgi:hypothetical protein